MNQIRLDLYLVEVFCYVYEHNNFSKAAEQLRISQPTISGHIKNLEDYVGMKLFNRLPRRVIPTRAGQLLYQHGRSILNEKEAAVRGLNKLRNCIEGSLIICSSTTPGEYLLPRIIASFHSKHPAVAVDLRISDSEVTCHEVLSGRVELGVVGAKVDGVGLEFHRFASDSMVLVAPNNDQWRTVKSITLGELAKVPFLAREAGSGSRIAFEKEIKHPLEKFNLVGYFGSTSAIKEALRANLGVSVLSHLSVKTEIESGVFKVVNIKGVNPIERELFTVLNKNLARSPVADAFLSVLGMGQKLNSGNGHSANHSGRKVQALNAR
jgi:DNA-binding transcriptional LysR family regulator